jgi:hypothetical protein
MVAVVIMIICGLADQGIVVKFPAWIRDNLFYEVNGKPLRPT